MIGTKLYKGKYTNKEYADCAVWCNANNAIIEDKGEYYECVAIPEPLPPTKEEQQKAREEAYKAEVDPITCHINRLKDEEQTPEVITEIASLVEERKAKVEEIKQRYPYPVEESEEVIEDGLQR